MNLLSLNHVPHGSEFTPDATTIKDKMPHMDAYFYP